MILLNWSSRRKSSGEDLAGLSAHHQPPQPSRQQKNREPHHQPTKSKCLTQIKATGPPGRPISQQGFVSIHHPKYAGPPFTPQQSPTNQPITQLPLLLPLFLPSLSLLQGERSFRRDANPGDKHISLPLLHHLCMFAYMAALSLLPHSTTPD